MWDISVGGSAVAGDNSIRAAEREVFEELGLKLDLSGERPFLTMNFSEGFDDFYIVEQDIDLGAQYPYRIRRTGTSGIVDESGGSDQSRFSRDGYR